MTDADEERSRLIPSPSGGELAVRSRGLVRRGLDLADRLDVRYVQFPEEYSLGTLYVRPSGREDSTWNELGKARGVVTVQPDQDLMLSVSRGSPDIAPLANLNPHDLQHLRFPDPAITDADVVHLERLTGLRALSFGVMCECPITDRGLAAICKLPNLEILRLDGSQITDDGLTHLQRLPDLRELGLTFTRISDSGLCHLGRVPQLRKLALGLGVTDAGLAHLERFTGLQDLFVDSTKVTDKGLAHVERLTGLRKLCLLHANVTDAGMARLQAALPECDIFRH